MVRALSTTEVYNEEHNLVFTRPEPKMIVKISKEWAGVRYGKVGWFSKPTWANAWGRIKLGSSTFSDKHPPIPYYFEGNTVKKHETRGVGARQN